MNFQNFTKEAKIELFKKLLSEIDLSTLDETPQFSIIPIAESMTEAKERVENPDKIYGLETGIDGIDKLLRGMAPEDLIVLSGSSGAGKTQLAQTIIMNVALNADPVLFFTLEMPPVETTVRFMRMSKSYEVGDILNKLPIYYYHGTNASLPVLEEAIKQGKEQGIKLVVIDHLHFFAKGNENQSSEIGNIARSIKLMARKYEIPIILLAHIRKTTNPNKMPTLDDLKDSSGVAQDADAVIMILRDMETRDAEKQRNMKIRIRKNRRTGHLGALQMRLDDNYCLKEVEYEEDDE